MIKETKDFLKKYESMTDELHSDKLWNEVENGLKGFRKRIKEENADGYFWTMYYNLIREKRILFLGIHSKRFC